MSSIVFSYATPQPYHGKQPKMTPFFSQGRSESDSFVVEYEPLVCINDYFTKKEIARLVGAKIAFQEKLYPGMEQWDELGYRENGRERPKFAAFRTLS